MDTEGCEEARSGIFSFKHTDMLPFLPPVAAQGGGLVWIPPAGSLTLVLLGFLSVGTLPRDQSVG